MAELEQSEASGFKVKEGEQQKSTRSLAENIALLSKVGGFQFVESLIDGAQNLNPERKARKTTFLTDSDKRLKENL